MAQIKESITVFPARAGVIPAGDVGKFLRACLSRTSGGDPVLFPKEFDADKSFPHERG